MDCANFQQFVRPKASMTSSTLESSDGASTFADDADSESDSLSIATLERQLSNDAEIKQFPEVEVVIWNPQDVLHSMSRVISKRIHISSSTQAFATSPFQGCFHGDTIFDVEELATLESNGPARSELVRAVCQIGSGHDLEVDITHIQDWDYTLEEHRKQKQKQIDQEWVDIHYYMNAVFDPITLREEPYRINLRGVIKKSPQLSQCALCGALH
jgi:hypothetical protein